MMQHTPPRNTPSDSAHSVPSQSETDEYEGNITNRRIKRRALRSPELINSFKLEGTLNSFKIDITEHITNLFSAFQKNQDEKLIVLISDMNVIKQDLNEFKAFKIQTENKLEVLATQCKEVITTNTKLLTELDASALKIRQLENRLEDLNRQSCSFKIEIRNVPSKIEESEQDLQMIISNLMKTLNVEILPTDIRQARRLPAKPNLPRTILLELATMKVKKTIIQEYKNYNRKNSKGKLSTSDLPNMESDSTSKPVYIGDHLTPRVKTLFYRAREFAKENNYAFCWTANGRVQLREREGIKSIWIRDEEQLITMAQKI